MGEKINRILNRLSTEFTHKTRSGREKRGKYGLRVASLATPKKNIQNSSQYRETKARYERINAQKTKATDFIYGSKEYFLAKANNARLNKQKYKNLHTQNRYENIAKGYDKQAATAKTHAQLLQQKNQEEAKQAEPTLGQKIARTLNITGMAFDRTVKMAEVKLKIGALKALKADAHWDEHPWERFKIELQLLALKAKKAWEE